MKETDNRVYRKKEKAQGMVEFALTLPILLMLFFGIIEFGRLLFFYGAVVTSSREAARYGSAAGDVSPGLAYYEDCNGIRDAAIRIGGLAGVNGSNVGITYDRPEDTTVGVYGDCNPTFDPGSETLKLGDRIIVNISAQFQPIVPLINVPAITLQSVTKRTILQDVRVR